MQVLSSPTRGSGLSRVTLGRTEIGNVLDERYEAYYQCQLGAARLAVERYSGQ
jgi:hypothetical protein